MEKKERKEPFGRPTKYKQEYCDVVIKLGKEGFSKAEMAEYIDVDFYTLENWAENNEDFFIAFTRAREYSQSWWERTARKNLISPRGETFNSSLWSRSMSARFPDDYREKSITATAESGDQKIEVVIKSYEDNASQ